VLILPRLTLILLEFGDSGVLIVGLTGGIGSGKSIAAQTFRQLQITVVDADNVAREIVEPGTPELSEIIRHFGKSILTLKGHLDRAKLRKIIFSNSDEKIWLEKLLHPKIRSKIIEQLHSAPSPYAILESPLLIETNQKELVDRILLIDAPEDLQIKRTISRDNNSIALVQSIIKSQATRKQRQHLADDIILNDRDCQFLKDQITRLNQKYRKLAISNRKKHETDSLPNL